MRTVLKCNTQQSPHHGGLAPAPRARNRAMEVSVHQGMIPKSKRDDYTKKSTSARAAAYVCQAVDVSSGRTDHEEAQYAWDYQWCRVIDCGSLHTSMVAKQCDTVA